MAHLDRAVAGALKRAAALLFSVAVPFCGARAQIHDYQILRLLSYKTQCDPLRVEDRSAPTGPRRFFAACGNASFYPDGAEIACDDRDDDRSCRILTEPTRFDNLRLLNQGTR